MALSGDLLQSLQDSANARRSLLLEEIAEKESNKRKPGQYKAYWQGYYDDGDGKVLHEGKIYKVKVLGTTSLPLNGIVNLIITSTDFFANW